MNTMSPKVKTTAEYEAAIESIKIKNTGYELSKSESINGTDVYSRRPIWPDIGPEITRLSTLGGKEATFIYVYGDCISSTSTTTKISLPKKCQIIFTSRLLFPDITQPLQVDLPSGSSISFRTPSLPEGFRVVVNGGAEQTLPVFPDSFGVRLFINDSNRIPKGCSMPDDELGAIDYWDGLTNNGQAVQASSLNDNLPRLLQYQFILASIWIHTDTPTASSILSFITWATKGNKDVLEINLQANALIARLNTVRNGLDMYVPALDLDAAKSVLKARLASVVSFEASYRHFNSAIEQKDHVNVAAEIAFSHSSDVEGQYKFLEKQLRERYKSVVGAHETAKKRFETLQKEAASNANVFNEGVKKWQKEESNKQVTDAILSLVTLTSSVVVAVIAPPAAASAGGSAVEAVKKLTTVADGISKWRELLLGIRKVAELLGKLEKAVENIRKAVDNTKTIIKVLVSKVEDKVPEIQKVSLNDKSDVYNLSAQWDSYAVEVKTVLGPMEKNGIDGYSKYYSTLLKLPIYGKAILATQTALVETGDALTSVVLQQRVATRHSNRLKAAITNIGNKSVLHIVQRAMFERLLSARTWAAVDFNEYLAAYSYFSLDPEPPIHISVAKSAAEFVDDAAKLQAAVALVHSSLRSQERSFVFTSGGCPSVFVSDWKEQLKKDRALSFTIDVTDPQIARFARVRVSRARCYISGATSTTSSTVDLRISSATRFRDIQTSLPHKTVDFVGEAMVRYFEYAIDGGRVVTDGVFLDAGVYSRPALFTTWTIEVLDKNIKLDDVEEVRFEVLCEVSRKDGAGTT